MSLIQAIDALLPQTQCGKCGHPGCLPYATGIASGEAINKCPPGGQETIHELADLLGVEPTPLESPYPPTPAQVAYIREADCIGCTKCIQACPVDAIAGAAKLMHTVISAECTGCELCITPCPVDCIDLQPLPVELSQQEKRHRAVYYRARYEARAARLSRDEQRKQAEREARLARVKIETTHTAPLDPVQAAIARVKAQKSAVEHSSADLKRLKINASMTQVALQKAEKQLALHATEELAQQVVALRQTAEAARQALKQAEGNAETENKPLPDIDPLALRRAKVTAAMSKAQLNKAQKAFGVEPSVEQQMQLDSLRRTAEEAVKALTVLERSTEDAACDPATAEQDRLAEEQRAPETEQTPVEPLSHQTHTTRSLLKDETRRLKVQLAYAKAEFKRLERHEAPSSEALHEARTRLVELERQLAEQSAC
ncbi:electron transport complex protein RnfB [Pseudomonas duriflava]|uniref:Ion-translocating oxidoreductase complex subunit B n=1 Tax=Pseudomonas duriflava TaxID=459528 RepID=A0A562QBE7_9PSED|nr:electron transport complex subunit RsxB [Pseudomonas duriflava]TWI53510.1 electron transport complex protein RnfB [Pseudomonas duriflava]